jgi:hypothetical protein
LLKVRKFQRQLEKVSESFMKVTNLVAADERLRAALHVIQLRVLRSRLGQNNKLGQKLNRLGQDKCALNRLPRNNRICKRTRGKWSRHRHQQLQDQVMGDSYRHHQERVMQ